MTSKMTKPRLTDEKKRTVDVTSGQSQPLVADHGLAPPPRHPSATLMLGDGQKMSAWPPHLGRVTHISSETHHTTRGLDG